MGAAASSFLVGIVNQYYNGNKFTVVFEFIGGKYKGNYYIDFDDGSQYQSKNAENGDQVTHIYNMTNIQNTYTVKFYNYNRILVKTLNVCVPAQSLTGVQDPSGNNNNLLIVDINGNQITFLYTGSKEKNCTMNFGTPDGDSTTSNVTAGSIWEFAYPGPGFYVATLSHYNKLYGIINVFISQDSNFSPYSRNHKNHKQYKNITVNNIYCIDN